MPDVVVDVVVIPAPVVDVTVLDARPIVDVTSVGVQGPPGVAGPPGPAAGPFRLGHTWGLVGDVSSYTTLPALFLPLLGTQTAVLVALRTQLGSGTSVGVQVVRNGSAVGGAITVTTTAATTALGDVALVDGDAVGLVLSNPVGGPSNLSATLIVEHTPGPA